MFREAISKQVDDQVRNIVMQCYQETLELVGVPREKLMDESS